MAARRAQAAQRQGDKVALRGRIVGMRESGLSTCDIAEEVGVHRTTVYRWLKRWDEEGNLRDHSKPGRARKTTAEEDRRIREYFETHPFSNAIAAREHLQLDLSAETIRKRMKEMGFRHRTPAIKPKLTERHRELRLQFAQRYDEENVYQVARSGRVTCNVWGWIFLHGVGEVTEIEGRFTSDTYLEILEEVMLPSVRSYALPPYKISKTTENMNVTTALQTVYFPELMLNHNGDWYENMNFRQGYKGKPCRADFNGH
ncbi:hypothetical protein Pmani_025344 [Petrolisthes manimaculis]|uniref:Transposase Tc1-like domain-containing protein n=2 Tax=Petrolisthes manimaculis TaxID=1843537 RepID=A0AAE1TXQ8_9EUCA|nr:hypothetical protein Pmani_025344 [Petrolisthes manimaculis]